MSDKDQLTFGVITKMEPKELYLLVRAETDYQRQHYVTELQVGFTNYRLGVGDTLSWSSVLQWTFLERFMVARNRAEQ
jgi:hypothetical protein